MPPDRTRSFTPAAGPDAGPVLGRLTVALLDAYERSVNYDAPGPWRRAVLVRVDRVFPTARDADAGALAEEVRDACIALEAARAALIVRGSGWASDLPEQVRVQAEHLPALERLGESLGYRPLKAVEAELARGIHALLDQANEESAPAQGRAPDWMATYLSAVLDGLGRHDFRALGVGRETLKRDAAEVHDALRAAAAIASGAHGWERMVSEQLFRDTKRLAAIRARVAAVLTAADPVWRDWREPDAEPARAEGAAPDPAEVLESYGVRRQAPALVVAGGGVVRAGRSALELRDFAPHATLPASWSEPLGAALAAAATRTVTTVENYYAFLAYADERGGPERLAAEGEVVIYTAGPPAEGLVAALRALRAAAPSVVVRHWGDADVGGVRIWRTLREQTGGPVLLFRTSASWVRSSAERGTVLSQGERRALRALRVLLATTPADADAPADYLEVIALVDAMLEQGVKIEQEGYQADHQEGSPEAREA